MSFFNYFYVYNTLQDFGPFLLPTHPVYIYLGLAYNGVVAYHQPTLFDTRLLTDINLNYVTVGKIKQNFN